MKKLIQGTLLLAALNALPAASSHGLNDMKNTTQDIAAAQHLIDLHFEIWNDTNPDNWGAKFARVYTTDFFVADYQGMATGYDQVAKLLARVQGEHAGFVFSPDPITWNHGVGRVTWGYGPQDKPNLVRGEDIFTIENGKLASARVFINKN